MDWGASKCHNAKSEIDDGRWLPSGRLAPLGVFGARFGLQGSKGAWHGAGDATAPLGPLLLLPCLPYLQTLLLSQYPAASLLIMWPSPAWCWARAP
jgi:hypothetical protein